MKVYVIYEHEHSEPSCDCCGCECDITIVAVLTEGSPLLADYQADIRFNVVEQEVK